MPSVQASQTWRQPMTALVVDDEEHSRRNLSRYLQTYCPEVAVVAEASSASSAKQLIQAKEPDAVFLDIQMPQGSGFDLLRSLNHQNFLLVFVTAHDNYGVQAIKASAVDYLMKPINIQELQEAVEKLVQLHHNQSATSLDVYKKSLTELTRALQSNTLPQKIVLPTNEGLVIESIHNIVRLEAEGYCTVVVRKDLPNVILAKTLKDFEGALDPERFVRIHNSHIVNMSFLTRFDKRDGGQAIMADSSRIPVSRRRHALLLEKLKGFRWI